ncbi:flagellar basal body rod protein FlgB [Evansella cellulosilytica]|uniref:Flagellar basal body rod protein FlgB n=1 Tax=Evansella cellulosilytica (strain ATCC 21833 / DSM 2522 / FERM P-1141 / JCM 9156 / N-4) TaxID=649639 RepID=E6TSX1_EVAC2|nr:flagellar basal body rod protein FlgB [Evansella cellulosilytica]ADU30763.1 flagellar basal-body rod protein FlgB [Evansella cellulosilytica DSM 2522]
MNLFNNSTTSLLETALSASMTRHNTIAQNIANVDTPNYKAKKAVFSHELNSAMNNQRLAANRTDARHIEFSSRNSTDEVQVIERNNTQYNHNGNNVDVDLEMAELAKNQIYYNTLIDRMNGRFNSIRTAIGQGR